MNKISGYYTLLFLVSDVSADSSIVGSMQEWSPDDPDYALTENDNNVWELTKLLSAGDYEYKVIEGDNWDAANYPTTNQSLNISSETIITWKVNQIDELVFDSEHPPIVCGDFMNLIGAAENWDHTSILTQMVDNGIGGDETADDDIYTYQVDGIPVGVYECKIVLNNNCNQSRKV